MSDEAYEPQPAPQPGTGPRLARPIGRRKFLIGGAGAALAAVMAGQPVTREILSLLAGSSQRAPDTVRRGQGLEGLSLTLDEGAAPHQLFATPSYSLNVERQEDLVLLDFFFYNFSIVDNVVDGNVVPGFMATEDGSIVVVRFPPQAISEGAYVSSTSWPVDPPPVLSLMSGPSQLAFTFQEGSTIWLPGSVTDLLDWSDWTLLVPEQAQVTGLGENLRRKKLGAHDFGPDNDPPLLQETYIEYPPLLYISPMVYVSGGELDSFTTVFRTSTSPITSPANVTELWTATLQQSGYLFGPEPAQIVAVGQADPTTGPSGSSVEEIVYPVGT